MPKLQSFRLNGVSGVADPRSRANACKGKSQIQSGDLIKYIIRLWATGTEISIVD